MIKRAGYLLFAFFFAVFRLCPLQRNKVFFVATHDDSDEGNIGIVAAALREREPDMKLVFLTKRDGIRHPFSFFVVKAYHMARAGTIFMDNEFMPMAYTPVSKKAKVVQLWHGTGSIKKFGLDVEQGQVAVLAEKANRRITHLIVNSELTKRQYASAFGVPEERIFVLGLPRTDLILDGEKMEEKRALFYREFPSLENKRCILYAPTFRDDETESPSLGLDLEHFVNVMGPEDVLLLRLHPHVARHFSLPEDECFGGRVVNMSDYRGVTTLMAVSDCLVTDYSSIIFEYCLLGKPMIFYACDLDVFRESGRGFYEEYESYVPGPVVRNQRELEELWRKGPGTEEDHGKFCRTTFQYLDQNAVNRLFQLIFPG